MTFPDTPLDLRIEADLNGTWTDLSARLDHGPLTISRGHPDESTTVSPSTLAVTLTDNDGALSTKNPVSPFYPYLVRNTPLRVSIPAQSAYMRIETDTASYAQAPDTAALRITGDIDIRIDIRPSSYAFAALCGKNSGGSGPAWLWELNRNGTVTFFWWDAASTQHTVRSTVPIPYGRVALRVTLAVATGTVTYYTAPSIGGTWTQLGAANSGTGGAATTIFAGTAPLRAGDNSSAMYGRHFAFQLRNGIGGTLVASPDFTAQAAGTASFADGQGNTWTLNGTAEISSRDYRGHFELAEVPQEQSPGGKSVLAQIAGGGLLRRHGQRNNPVNSAMYRGWTRVTSAVLAAYWPGEDGAGAGQIASASGGPAMDFGRASLPKLAANSDFACSAALPVLNNSQFSGRVFHSGPWTDNQVAFLMEIPSAGETNGAGVLSYHTSGTVAVATLSYGTGGNLTLAGYDATGAQLFTSGLVAFNADGAQMLVAVALQNAGGGNITWHVDAWTVGAATPLGISGTVAGTVGAVTDVVPGPGGGLAQTVMGHWAVLTAYQQLYNLFTYVTPSGLTTGALSAWAGEPAGIRFRRLCSEEGIPFRSRGNLDLTQLMGTQSAQTLTQLLQECADADRGTWYELRQQLGWGYVTRSALYNQGAQVTVDYTRDHLSMWQRPPTEDDQVIVNDATVSQTSGGSSARQFAAPGQPIGGGRLSTLPPPAGAGTYDQAYSLNLYAAGDLNSEAGWITHVGTVDQPRFPGIVLDLANRDLAALYWAILDMELGDRMVIVNPPPWLGPDAISQLAQQLGETLWTKQLEIGVCGVPELPYEVAADGLGYHVDTDGSVLQAAVSASAVQLAVSTANPSSPPWTTAAADFPFDAGAAGERMTVTNIDGPPANFLTLSGTFDAGLQNWAPTGGNSAVAPVTSPVHSGTGAMSVTATAAGVAAAQHCSAAQATADGLPCSPGDMISVAAWFRAAAAGNPCQVGVNFKTSAGGAIAVLLASPAVTDTAGDWVKVAGTVTAPATAAFAIGYAQVTATGAGEVHYVDDAYISGPGYPAGAGDQTLTVTRSVNGVVKSHAAGTPVTLWQTPIAAL